MVGFETTKSALAVSADFVVHDIASKGNQTAVGEPLHRYYRASPHSRGRGVLRCDA